MALEGTIPDDPGGDPARERRRELLTFLFLAIVLGPALSVAVVGGFGFVVWIVQILAGPPGPPGT